MTTSAVLLTMTHSAQGTTRWRWRDDVSTDDRETPRYAVAGHGRSLSAAVGKCGDGWAHLRRAFGDAGGWPCHLAGEQGVAAAAEDVAVRGGALRRRRQLPARAATGWSAVPGAAAAGPVGGAASGGLFTGPTG